jgi:hypothetical protein
MPGRYLSDPELARQSTWTITNRRPWRFHLPGRFLAHGSGGLSAAGGCRGVVIECVHVDTLPEQVRGSRLTSTSRTHSTVSVVFFLVTAPLPLLPPGRSRS